MRRSVLILLCLLLALPLLAQESYKYRPGLGGRNKNHVPTPPPGGGGGGDNILVTQLVAEHSDSNASSYVSTATLSCPASAVCFCFVAGETTAGAIATPTLTQTGQTWTRHETTGVEPVTFNTIASPTSGLYLFRSLGAAAAAATLTMDFGAAAMTGYGLACYQAIGVNLGGTNGSSAVQQAVGAQSDGATTATVTLAALQTDGGVLMAASTASGASWTAESGYAAGTELSPSAFEARAQWHLGAGITDATPTWTFANSVRSGAIAIELVPGASGDNTDPIVGIESPTVATSIEVSVATGFDLAGSCTDNVACTALTWACTTGTCTPDNGVATGTSSWTITDVTLPCDANGETVIFTVTATDAAANTGTDELTVTCIVPDTIAPTVQITQPTPSPTDATATASYPIGGIAADETTLSTVTWACPQCSVTSGTATGTTTWSATLTLGCSAAPGTANVITVTATDAGANTAQDVLTTTCTSADVTDPVITITTNSGSNFTASSLPQTIAGTASDVGSGLASISASCTNASPASPLVSGTINWSFSLTGIVSGNASVCTVTALDNAGNDATDTITVTYIANLLITTTTLGALTEDQSGQVRCVSATGGVAPYTWTVSAGALPTGMSLTGSVTATECFNGTPTTAQTVTPTFQVVDSQGMPDSDTQQISVTVNAAGSETSHSYFDYQVDNRVACSGTTLDNCIVQITNCVSTIAGDNGGCSLRSTAQVAALRTGTTHATQGWHYVFGSGDSYADPQDAAKMFVLGGTKPINQLDVLFNSSAMFASGDTLTIVLDEWWGAEWRQNDCGGTAAGLRGQWKQYRFYAPNPDTGKGNEWLQDGHNTRRAGQALFNGDADECQIIGTQHFSSAFSPSLICCSSVVAPGSIGVTRTDSRYTPVGQGGYWEEDAWDYPIYHSTWTRTVWHIAFDVPANSQLFSAWRADCDPAGTGTASDNECAVMLATIPDPDASSIWANVSVWVMDETRAARRMHYRIPIWNYRTTLARFRLLYDTSDTAADMAGTGDGVIYNRNWVAIRNITAADVDDADCPSRGGAACAGDVGAVNSNLFRKPVQ